MNDVALTRALERGEIPKRGFPHASHLHVAWVYLAESSSVGEAARKMSDTIRKVASASGHPEKFHQTITLFWIYLLHRMRLAATDKSLEQVVHRDPRLLKKNFPLVYYSRDLLFSERARASWVEPDLKPLFIDGATFCSSRSSRDAPDRALP